MLEAKGEIEVAVWIREKQFEEIGAINAAFAQVAKLRCEFEKSRFMNRPIQPLEVKILGTHDPK